MKEHNPNNLNQNTWLAGLSWLVMAALILAALPARATNYYWDNLAGAGFGTAGGTWFDTGNTGIPGWNTDSTGAAAPGTVITTTGDQCFFGSDTLALGSGTVAVSGTNLAQQLKFGKVSGAITLGAGVSSGMVLFGTGTSLIQASSAGGTASATHTINSDIFKSSGTLQFGQQTTGNEKYIVNGYLNGAYTHDNRVNNNTGFVALNNPTNTFSGPVTIITGDLQAKSVADSGTACSLGAGFSISIGGGGGQQPSLIYTGTSAGSMNRAIVLNVSGGPARIVSQNAPLTLTGSISPQPPGTLFPTMLLSGDAGGGTNYNVITDAGGGISGATAVYVVVFTPVGGVSKQGAWRLSGNHSYTGTTTVQNSSKLQVVVGGSASSSALILNNNATHSVLVTDNTQSWTYSNLTNSSSTTTLEFSFGSVTPSTTVSPLNITGTAAFNVTPNNVNVVVDSGLAAGVYPLMTWATPVGTPPANVTISTLASGTYASLSNSATTLYLVINTGLAPVAYWDNNGTTAGFGTASGTWASPTTGNASQGWSSDPAGSVLPANSTTDSSSSLNFGNGATGLGAGTITVSGNVTNSQMTFASGSGAITLSGGTINFPAAGSITVNNTNGATISSALAGASSTLATSGTLTLSGANTYGGVTTVGSGILTVNNGSALGTTSSNTVVASGAGLLVQGGITSAEPIVLSGSGVTPGPHAQYGALLSTNNNTLTGPIVCGTPGARLATLGTGTLTLSGGLTMNSTATPILVGDFTINSNPINLGSYGMLFAGDGATVPPVTGKTIRLNVAGNTWTNALLFFAAIVQLGVDNAMPASASVQLGFSDVNNSRSTLDLNGHNQTVASIETYNPAVSGANISITGGGTLTVNQSANKLFTGIISDGATPTALTKTGSGILALSGTNTYTGATTVSNGVLRLTNSPSVLPAAAKVYLFTAAGSLDLAFTGTNQIAALYINGVAQVPGVYDNTTSPITGTGKLQVVGPPPPPTIAPVTVSGTNLVVTVPTTVGYNYVLQSTTNLTPVINWQNLSTNAGTGGNLILNVPIDPATPQKFLRFWVY